VAATAAAAMLALWGWLRPQEQAPVLGEIRLPVEPPGSAAVSAGFPSISADGQRLVYTADIAGTARLFARTLNSLELRELPGSAGANPDSPTFFSPELDAVELVVATERGEGAERLCTCLGVIEHTMDRGLVEPRIHHEGMDLYTFEARSLDDARIHTAAYDAGGVHVKDLWCHDRDLVGVREERLNALLTAQIPECFQPLCAHRGCARTDRQCSGDAAARHRVATMTHPEVYGLSPAPPTPSLPSGKTC
jgi:hypothetical protein